MAREKQFRLTRISLVFILLVSVTMAGLSDTTEQPSTFRSQYLRSPQSVKLGKFSLTQKGYIQFLRYVTEVPPIGDFTFCIWMRSANLTYSHPLLSYSRHESERLIRAWVTPGGDEIRLAVKEVDIIRVPVALKENQWYHICQSWSTKTGHWDLFLNGKLKSHGYNNKARGQILPKEGDIVVGQEYTDFDKGLDDGIEGDIFGFNMVLVSTSAPQKGHRNQKEPVFNVHRRVSTPEKIKGHYIVEGGPLYIRRAPKSVEQEQDNFFTNNNTTSTSTEEQNTSDSAENLNDDSNSKREKRQSYNMYPMSFVRYVLAPPQKLMKPVYPYLYPSNQYAYRYTLPQIQKTMLPPMPTFRSKISRIANDIPVYTSKPLGLQLVELSYDCARGKGAPITGKDVLISWRKTPVRVFGGAILKKVDPFCY